MPHLSDNGRTNPALVARIIAAYETAEAGDTPEAVSVLKDLAHDLLVSANPCSCGGCGRVFEWPGLRDAHQAATGCGAVIESDAA